MPPAKREQPNHSEAMPTEDPLASLMSASVEDSRKHFPETSGRGGITTSKTGPEAEARSTTLKAVAEDCRFRLQKILSVHDIGKKAPDLLEALLDMDPTYALTLLSGDERATDIVPLKIGAGATLVRLIEFLRPHPGTLKDLRLQTAATTIKVLPTCGVVSSVIAGNPVQVREILQEVTTGETSRDLLPAVAYYSSEMAPSSLRLFARKMPEVYTADSSTSSAPLDPTVAGLGIHAIRPRLQSIVDRALECQTQGDDIKLREEITEYLSELKALVVSEACQQDVRAIACCFDIGRPILGQMVASSSSQSYEIVNAIVEWGGQAVVLREELPEPIRSFLQHVIPLLSDQAISEIPVDSCSICESRPSADQIIEWAFLGKKEIGILSEALGHLGKHDAEEYARSGLSSLHSGQLPYIASPELVRLLASWYQERFGGLKGSPPRKIFIDILTAGESMAARNDWLQWFRAAISNPRTRSIIRTFAFLVALPNIPVEARLQYALKLPRKAALACAVVALEESSFSLSSLLPYFRKARNDPNKRLQAIELLAHPAFTGVVSSDPQGCAAVLAQSLSDDSLSRITKKSVRRAIKEAAGDVLETLSIVDPQLAQELVCQQWATHLPPFTYLRVAYAPLFAARAQNPRRSGDNINMSECWVPNEIVPIEPDPFLCSVRGMEKIKVVQQIGRFLGKKAGMHIIDTATDPAALELQLKFLEQEIDPDAEVDSIVVSCLNGEIPVYRALDRLIGAAIVRWSDPEDVRPQAFGPGLRFFMSRAISRSVPDVMTAAIKPDNIDQFISCYLRAVAESWCDAIDEGELDTTLPFWELIGRPLFSVFGDFAWSERLLEHLNLSRSAKEPAPAKGRFGRDRRRSPKDRGDSESPNVSVPISGQAQFLFSGKMIPNPKELGSYQGIEHTSLRHLIFHVFDRFESYTFNYRPVSMPHVVQLLHNCLNHQFAPYTEMEIRIDSDHPSITLPFLVGAREVPRSLEVIPEIPVELSMGVARSRRVSRSPVEENPSDLKWQIAARFNAPENFSAWKDVSIAELRRKLPAGVEHLSTPWISLDQFHPEVREFIRNHPRSSSAVGALRGLEQLIRRLYPYDNNTQDHPAYRDFLNLRAVGKASPEAYLASIRNMAASDAEGGRGNCVQTAFLLREIGAHLGMPVLIARGLLIRGPRLTENDFHSFALTFLLTQDDTLAVCPLDRDSESYLSVVDDSESRSTTGTGVVSQLIENRNTPFHEDLREIAVNFIKDISLEAVSRSVLAEIAWYIQDQYSRIRNVPSLSQEEIESSPAWAVIDAYQHLSSRELHAQIGSHIDNASISAEAREALSRLLLHAERENGERSARLKLVGPLLEDWGPVEEQDGEK